MIAGKLRKEIKEDNTDPQCNVAERGSGPEYEKEEVPMKGYVISFSKKRKLKRLHNVQCWRTKPLDAKSTNSSSATDATTSSSTDSD